MALMSLDRPDYQTDEVGYSIISRRVNDRSGQKFDEDRGLMNFHKCVNSVFSYVIASLISIALITYARSAAYVIICAHNLGSRDRRNFSVDRETD